MFSVLGKFSGKEENVNAFKKEIKRLYKKSECGEKGVFIDKTFETALFFNDGIESLDDDQFHFETKWIPTINSILTLATKFRVNIEYDYEELGCLIYGKLIYNSLLDKATKSSLEDEDWTKIKENGNPYMKF